MKSTPDPTRKQPVVIKDLKTRKNPKGGTAAGVAKAYGKVLVNDSPPPK